MFPSQFVSGHAVGSAGLGLHCRAGPVPSRHPGEPEEMEAKTLECEKGRERISSAPRLHELQLAGRRAILQSALPNKENAGLRR